MSEELGQRPQWLTIRATTAVSDAVPTRQRPETCWLGVAWDDLGAVVMNTMQPQPYRLGLLRTRRAVGAIPQTPAQTGMLPGLGRSPRPDRRTGSMFWVPGCSRT